MDQLTAHLPAAAEEMPPSPAPVLSGRCRMECGQPLSRGVRRTDFCSALCRKAFNNRRAMRGAELYDLLMEWRFDRSKAKERRTFSHLCTILGRFNDEDRKSRGKRRTWSSSRRLANMNSRLGR